MSLSKLAILSRKVHRFLVLIITVLGTVMAATGLTMHEAGEENNLFPFFDLNLAEKIHNTLSVYFTLVLGLMILTGLFLYLFPYITKFYSNRSTPKSL
jgi:hypothetical protein